MRRTVLVMLAGCVLCTNGCYPAPLVTPTAMLIVADVPYREDINKALKGCRDQVEAARTNAYDLHKAAYYAGLWGSATTMVFGGGAGGLGAGQQEALSGISGAAALVSGVVTLLLVNKPGLKAAEETQAKMLDAWNAMREAKSAYEEAVIMNGPASSTKKLLSELVKAINDCGLTPPAQILEAATLASDGVQ